ATSNDARPTLGRNLSSGTATVPLMQPGTLYADSFNKVDARFSKIFKVGRNRITGSLDIFNLFNGAGIVQVNTRYGPNWLNPIQIIGARFFRVSGQIDF